MKHEPIQPATDEHWCLSWEDPPHDADGLGKVWCRCGAIFEAATLVSAIEAYAKHRGEASEAALRAENERLQDSARKQVADEVRKKRVAHDHLERTEGERDALQATLDAGIEACKRGVEIYDGGDLDHYRVRCGHATLAASDGTVVDCPYCEILAILNAPSVTKETRE